MECFDAVKVHAYRRCGCVIIKKIVCGARMNFNHVVSIHIFIFVAVAFRLPFESFGLFALPSVRYLLLFFSTLPKTYLLFFLLDFNSIYNFPFYLMFGLIKDCAMRLQLIHHCIYCGP